MAGSTWGTLFRVTTWGESHGKAMGVVIDGCPAGLALSEEDICAYLERRKPAKTPYATKRAEGDLAQILSGVFEGRTTGTPISILIPNQEHHTSDYEALRNVYRPGHADYTYDEKYGFRDHRGGGRASGRETVCRVAAGAVAVKILKELGITFTTYAKAIGPVVVPDEEVDVCEIANNAFFLPSAKYAEEAAAYLDACMEEQDSCGGVIECRIDGVPAGTGEPVFDKLDADLAKAVMSIGSVKAVEIGDGAAVAAKRGSENNDEFSSCQGEIRKTSNHAGGMLGGISDGSRILLRAAIKPTPSIGKQQKTVTCAGEETVLSVGGRHDPVIVPRAAVVVEAMTAMTLTDLLLRNMSARMQSLTTIYCAGDNERDNER